MTTRWLAGSFDRACAEPARLRAALAPHQAELIDAGPLQVVHSGPAAASGAPLCLLDGFLDNGEELADALGLGEECEPELLLRYAWRRWGAELPVRMRGDFALLVWDNERGEGLLARDQLGVRSLFLHEGGGGLRFASEIRHLLALLPTRPAPDHVTLAHWIAVGERPGDASVYAGIRRLNPGAALLLSADGAREVRYWSPRFRASSVGEPQLAEEVKGALGRAVARRIAPAGETGVLMSGGLDSSSVAAVAASLAPGRVRAQAAVFPDHPGVDESSLIDALRSSLALPGTTVRVRAGGLLASALESTAEWKVPLISWGDFWALPLLRAGARGGARVTLGGEGGDELFGARTYVLADRLRGGHPLQALRLIGELPGAGNHPSRREMARIFGRIALAGSLPYRVGRLAQRPLLLRDAPAWLRGRVRQDLLASSDPQAWKRLDGPRWWAETAYVLTRGVEEVGVFEHQRRRASSAGLEARHPLFDLELVELGMAIDPLASFNRYRNRPVLRAAMAGLLPDDVRLRPQKALFDPLLIDSLQGPDGELARELLCGPDAELRAFVDQAAMAAAVFGGRRSQAPPSFAWMAQLWRLLTAECWLRSQHGEHALEPLLERAAPARVELSPAGADA